MSITSCWSLWKPRAEQLELYSARCPRIHNELVTLVEENRMSVSGKVTLGDGGIFLPQHSWSPCWSLFFFFLPMLCVIQDPRFPTRDRTCALWKHRVLTTGPSMMCVITELPGWILFNHKLRWLLLVIERARWASLKMTIQMDRSSKRFMWWDFKGARGLLLDALWSFGAGSWIEEWVE